MNPRDILTGLVLGAAVTAGVEVLQSSVRHYYKKVNQQQKLNNHVSETSHFQDM